MFFSPMEQFDLVPLFLFKIEFINSILSYILTYIWPTTYVDNMNYLLVHHAGYWMEFFPGYFESEPTKQVTYMYFYGISPDFWAHVDLEGFSFGRDLIKVLSFFFLSNYVLYLFLSIGSITVMFLLTMKVSKFVPSVSQLLLESFYNLWFIGC